MRNIADPHGWIKLTDWQEAERLKRHMQKLEERT